MQHLINWEEKDIQLSILDIGLVLEFLIQFQQILDNHIVEKECNKELKGFKLKKKKT